LLQLIRLHLQFLRHPCKLDDGLDKTRIIGINGWISGPDITLFYKRVELLRAKHPYNYIANSIRVAHVTSYEGKALHVCHQDCLAFAHRLVHRGRTMHENTICMLSEVVQNCINPHLKVFVVPLLRKLQAKTTN